MNTDAKEAMLKRLESYSLWMYLSEKQKENVTCIIKKSDDFTQLFEKIKNMKISLTKKWHLNIFFEVEKRIFYCEYDAKKFFEIILEEFKKETMWYRINDDKKKELENVLSQSSSIKDLSKNLAEKFGLDIRIQIFNLISPYYGQTKKGEGEITKLLKLKKPGEK